MNAVEEITADLPLAVEGVGDRLRAAREARGMSLADIAQTLKFSPRQLELIEANAWAELPGLTFVRGCVRTYARLLQLDPVPLLRDLDSANLPKAAELSVPGSTHATLPTPGRAAGGDRLAVLAGLLLVVVAAAAYFVIPEDFWRQHTNPAPLAAKAEAPAPLAAAPASPLAATPLPAAAPATPAAVDNPLPAAPASPVLPPPTEAPNPENRVRFEFSRPSWVEVRDANGVLLHSQNNVAGSIQEVSGTLPLSIIIGDVSGVRMTYRDKPVDLAAYTKPNSNVARLNVE